MSSRLTPSTVAAKAAAVGRFIKEHEATLAFGNYDSLRETAAILEALAAYLTADDPQAYLVEQLAIADQEIASWSDWLGLEHSERRSP